MFFRKPTDVSKFYTKTKRRVGWASFATFLAAATVVAGAIWFNLELHSLSSLVPSIASTLSDSWKKWTCGGVAAAAALGAFVGAVRKMCLYRKIRRSIRQLAGDYSDPLSDFVKDSFLLAHINKNNSFWFWSMVMVLSFLTFFWSTAIGLYSLAAGGTPNLFSLFGSSSSSFSPSTPVDFVWLGSLGAFWLVYLFLLLTQLRKRSKIESIWSLCGKDHPELLFWNDAVVMPRLLRNNKRNKLFIYLTFCVLGFPIYFFLKRALGTIFRSNMNNKYA